ncbi:MAG: hypothetical protein AB8C13_08735 [Phycisphaerales bacterium]
MPTPASRKTDWKDEYTLLCERCGYIIEDLDQSLPCPECGKPITESLPERRVATPWQQKRKFKSFMHTWWMTIRRPKSTLDTMSFNESEYNDLAAYACIATHLVPISTTLALLLIDGSFSRIASILLCVFSFVPVWLTLMALTATESFGLRFIGNRRGFRIDKIISNNIVAHGAAGWLLIGLGSTLGALLILLPDIIDSNFIPVRIDFNVIGWWIILFSFLAGFLFFETFAYLGLRRCKYANRSRPNPAPERTNNT